MGVIVFLQYHIIIIKTALYRKCQNCPFDLDHHEIQLVKQIWQWVKIMSHGMLRMVYNASFLTNFFSKAHYIIIIIIIGLFGLKEKFERLFMWGWEYRRVIGGDPHANMWSCKRREGHERVTLAPYKIVDPCTVLKPEHRFLIFL